MQHKVKILNTNKQSRQSPNLITVFIYRTQAIIFGTPTRFGNMLGMLLRLRMHLI